MKWFCSSFLYIIDFCTKTNISDKIKYFRLSKNTKSQQENRPTSYREDWLQTTGINWNKGNIGQKIFHDNSKDLPNANGPYLQILQMDKNHEYVLE